MLTQLTCFVSAISCLTESLESLPSYQLLLDSFSVYLLLFSLTFPSYFLSPQLLNVGGGTEWTFETPKPILRDHPSIRSIHTNLYKPFKYFYSLVIKHSNILAYGDYHIQTTTTCLILYFSLNSCCLYCQNAPRISVFLSYLILLYCYPQAFFLSAFLQQLLLMAIVV